MLALAALVNTGCLLAVAGLAGAGAAAGYVYYNGLLYRDYHANLADTLAAVRSALVELQFPIREEKTDTGSAFIKTHTSDGTTVRIYLDVVPSPIPAEGAITRVGIRVGIAGDEVVSAGILNQVNRHLVPPTMLPSPPGTTMAPPGSGVQLGTPRPAGETPAPPLAGTPSAATRTDALPLRPVPAASR
jgi:hypothetical protein